MLFYLFKYFLLKKPFAYGIKKKDPQIMTFWQLFYGELLASA
jgi:hypothetical protein